MIGKPARAPSASAKIPGQSFEIHLLWAQVTDMKEEISAPWSHNPNADLPEP